MKTNPDKDNAKQILFVSIENLFSLNKQTKIIATKNILPIAAHKIRNN